MPDYEGIDNEYYQLEEAIGNLKFAIDALKGADNGYSKNPKTYSYDIDTLENFIDSYKDRMKEIRKELPEYDYK